MLKNHKVFWVHLGIWLFLWLMNVIFFGGPPNANHPVEILAHPWFWICVVGYTSLFYLHAYFLLPALYYGGKRIFYFSIVALFFALVYLFKPFDHLIAPSTFQEGRAMPGKSRFDDRNDIPLPPGGFQDRPLLRPQDMPGVPGEIEGSQKKGAPFDIIGMMTLILILASGFGLQVTIRWKNDVESKARAETEKVNAEMRFLKAQINPHFLFNALNNIYALAVTQDNNTAESIMHLSEMMRYATDQSFRDFVPLTDEIVYLKNYLGLQQLKRSTKADLAFDLEGDVEGQWISPMMLIGFVENMFKHGTSKRESSRLEIKLRVTEETIQFACRNKIYPSPGSMPRQGIGIENIRKRLEYHYPGKHELHVTNNDGVFSVLLTLFSKTL